MVIFYAVMEGDPLSSNANSRVLEGAPGITIQGQDGRHRRQTFLGQKAWCDECKSVGVIVAANDFPVGRRMYEKSMRTHEALGGDWVLCHCDIHPRVVSHYGRSVMIHDIDEKEASVDGFSRSQHRGVDGCRGCDEGISVKSSVGNFPIPDYPYYVETSDGRSCKGRTEKNGALPRIATVDEEDCIVYWGDEALAKQKGM